MGVHTSHPIDGSWLNVIRAVLISGCVRKMIPSTTFLRSQHSVKMGIGLLNKWPHHQISESLLSSSKGSAKLFEISSSVPPIVHLPRRIPTTRPVLPTRVK